ncbi:MOSC N-terminal beta barrel domain-containing protein [Oceanisphaera sp. W20_SRM_FM3]|uniref:MOSC N-terminal beta barrel domain-containing protein n=1 Tax=Oceanisphaera sp. W20_SRM_FM3 TaxID=3240267 RepID=UPI003F9D6CA8
MAAITQLHLYPIKSAAGLCVEQAYVTFEGLLGDRRFMLAKLDGGFISARTHPRLQSIQVTQVAAGLDLRYGEHLLKVRHSEFLEQPVTVNVWDDNFSALSTHPDYHAWFSEILGEAVQFIWLGEHSQRYREKLNTAVSFADGYPLLLISEASLADLNLRADAHFLMSQFRPNLVVSAHRAFEEDGWRRIRIGEVEFVVAKPCSRCVMTTITPGTEHFNANKEPLATLLRYRHGLDNEVYFGQNLIAVNEGVICQGDPVEVLEYATAAIYADSAPKRRSLVCVAREALTSDIETYWLAASDGKALPSYQAGQHLPIAVDIDGQRYVRYYSLSSSPIAAAGADQYADTYVDSYAISVKRQPDGKVSSWLAERFQPGNTLLAHAPAGDFMLQAAERYLLLSAGSGITPMLSMVRTLAERQQLHDVVFMHVCRTEQDIPAAVELQQLVDKHPGMSLQFVLTQPQIGEGGRLTLGQLAAIPQLPTRQTYLCGPAGFMQQARSWLLALGLPATLLQQEYFGCLQSENVSCETQSVSIQIGERRFIGNNQRDLLTQAEQHGMTLPWSCRAGICGSCKQQLVSGEVEQPPAPALSATEREAGIVLVCCCVPLTDVILEL